MIDITLPTGLRADSLFILTDTNVARLYPEAGRADHTIVVPAGEENKSLATVQTVWRELENAGATRSSVLINLGGGVITDLGGFAAATFKRGIRFINIPTTLLGAVDASIGGKTGINFDGLKNQIGVFARPEAILVETGFFATLDRGQVLSGFGEMVKAALLDSDGMTWDMFNAARSLDDPDIHGVPEPIAALTRSCVRVKRSYVEEDFRDTGARNALNLGHTAAHAFESMLMRKGKPVEHGIAVAHGLLVALILSHMVLQADTEWVYRYRDHILRRYPSLAIDCDDIDDIVALMGHDKKRYDECLRFTLLNRPGDEMISVPVEASTIKAALDLYLDLR